MPFPKLRLTINSAEALLILPGLNTVVNGHAGAKFFGAYPNQHPYDRVDLVTSAVYQDRAYDEEMAGRFLALRNCMREITKSRKIRFDSVDLAVAGFALRLWKAHKPSDATEDSFYAVKRLQKRIESDRLRAKRAAIKVYGKSAYQETADRWRRFAGWAKYHLLYFKLPYSRQPSRAKFWREQRQQLTVAFATALKERFFEHPSDVEMGKLVTLASRSLKRGRHPMGLRELLKAPQIHTSFLVGFARKRLELARLPGAAKPAWQAAFDRAEIFRAFQEGRARTALPLLPVSPPQAIGNGINFEERVPATAIASISPEDQNARADGEMMKLTESSMLDSIVEWLQQTVTMDFAQSVCTEARSQISNQLLDQYRGPTITVLFEGLFDRVMNESRPAEFSVHRATMVRQYAGWLLRCLLTLRQNPEWMNHAIGVAMGRAKELEDEDHLAECRHAVSNGSHSARYGA